MSARRPSSGSRSPCCSSGSRAPAARPPARRRSSLLGAARRADDRRRDPVPDASCRWWLVLVHVTLAALGLGGGVVRSSPRSGGRSRMRDGGAELRIERRPELEQPGPGLLVPRLERRRSGRLARGGVPRARLAGRAVRRDRSRSSSSTSSRRGRTSRSSTGERAGSTGPRTRSSTPRLAEARRDVVLLLGTEPSLRWRTFSGARQRPRARPRRLAGRHARLAARRRAAHPARAGHRERDRSRAARRSSASRPPATRARPGRRRPARRLPRRRHPVGVALGGGAALRAR